MDFVLQSINQCKDQDLTFSSEIWIVFNFSLKTRVKLLISHALTPNYVNHSSLLDPWPLLAFIRPRIWSDHESGHYQQEKSIQFIYSLMSSDSTTSVRQMSNNFMIL